MFVEIIWITAQIPFDRLLRNSESQSVGYFFAVRCLASFRFRPDMFLTICFTHFVRCRSRTAPGRGHFWLISSHLDIFVSNGILLGMSVTSLFVTRLGRTQLGRGHSNTSPFPLNHHFRRRWLFEKNATQPKFDWSQISSRTNVSCFANCIVVSQIGISVSEQCRQCQL